MRTVLPLVTAVLLLGASDLRADEDAAAIIRKAIKAHGGEENLDKLMACMVESQGSLELYPNLAGVFEYTFKSELTAKPGKFKESVKIFQTINNGDAQPYMSIHNVYNGEGQIVRDGKGEFLKDQALKEFKAQAYHRTVCLLTPLLRDRKFKLTVVDRDAKVSGNAAVAIMVHHQDYQDIVLYFDKESGRLVKSKRDFFHVGKKKEMELLTFFSDFKTVEGAVIPHRVVTYHDGKQFSAERITKILVLETAPDEWFRIKE
jgi:hypothetical protein